MANFNWVDDPTKSGSPINVDTLNEDLMYLKETTDALTTQVADKVEGAGYTLWIGSQANYDLIAVKDSNTMYVINS